MRYLVRGILAFWCVATPAQALIAITDVPPPLVSAVCDGVMDDASAIQARLAPSGVGSNLVDTRIMGDVVLRLG